ASEVLAPRAPNRLEALATGACDPELASAAGARPAHPVGEIHRCAVAECSRRSGPVTRSRTRWLCNDDRIVGGKRAVHVTPCHTTPGTRRLFGKRRGNRANDR